MFKLKKQMYYNGKIYSSTGNKIKVAEKGKRKTKTYITIDELKLVNYFELYNRLFRHGIHNFYKIDEQIDCVIIKRKILFFKNRSLISELAIEKGSRPLRNGIVFRNDSIIYSEYHDNKNREPVNIYQYNFMEDKKEIIYTFNGIRHIHCIHQDLSDLNCIYVGTGDFDQECGIYRINLLNSKITEIGGGSQIWRAVSILQDRDKKVLYWGTDNPDGVNYIMRYNLEKDQLEKIREIDGPAYYSTITKKREMFIATTIEDRKKHRAIIYRSSDGENWGQYLEFKKDIFHTKYFGYGTVDFINNQENLDELMYNLNGLK